MKFIMELGCLVGLSLVALIIMAIFVLRERKDSKVKVLEVILALGLVIFCITNGWAVFQTGWFLEPGSLSYQVGGWGFMVLGITWLSFVIGLMKLGKVDKLRGILNILSGIAVIVYALYRMTQ